MNEIKKINVGGVAYDIVSESAEKKIAELEKNSTALASVTFGTRNDFGDPIKVGLGQHPFPSEEADIIIGKGTRIGDNVVIGSEYPVVMEWDSSGFFHISYNYGNGGTITIGSNVVLTAGSAGGGGISGDVQIDSSSQLRMSSAAINIDDTNLILNYDGLHFGTQGAHIGNNISLRMNGDAAELRNDRVSMCQLYAEACAIHIGSATQEDKGLVVIESGSRVLEIGYPVHIGNNLTIGSAVFIGDLVHIGANVSIGENLSSKERLHIQGPVYIKAEAGVHGLTIGTDDIGIIKISWSEADKIVFTNVTTGKKATLTLS